MLGFFAAHQILAINRAEEAKVVRVSMQLRDDRLHSLVWSSLPISKKVSGDREPLYCTLIPLYCTMIPLYCTLLPLLHSDTSRSVSASMLSLVAAEEQRQTDGQHCVGCGAGRVEEINCASCWYAILDE
jgi:hypothetical protein